MTRIAGRKSLPVLTYLVLIFGASVVALGALVTTTTMASFNRERNRVVGSLRTGSSTSLSSIR